MTIPSIGSALHTSSRLPAKATTKPVNFLCLTPLARTVFLVGDFNQWNSTRLPMKRHVDGSWQLSVPLGHGRHLYRYLVDGQPVNDPRAQGLTRNSKGEKVSMIMVS